jgi:hypothetical protein
MTNYTMWDYPPPRSWDQFEELCADIFQSTWRDPALVRHGRAGQRQRGVDIVARSGAIYPIGLQCKRREKWPVKKLTTAELNAEVKEAKKFKPTLKAFYILTTAPDDAKLQAHVRELNKRHEQAGLFEVVVLGWKEIVRRATLDPIVANKHFGPTEGETSGSPLLATWLVSKGKLEKTGEELSLSVAELKQDLRDWPTGHYIIRQRESDEVLQQLQAYEGKRLSLKQRQEKVKLREKLATLADKEKFAEWAVKVVLTDPIVSAWMLKIWDAEGDAPLAIESTINNAMSLERDYSPATYLRICAPKDGEQKVRCAAKLTKEEVSQFVARAEKATYTPFGPYTLLTSDLPPSIRAQKAVPAILRFLHTQMSEEQMGDELTWQQIRERGYLDIGNWWTLID